MSIENLNPTPTTDMEPTSGRPIGPNTTEHGWCRAVPGGTGQTILALLSSRPPQITSLQAAVDKMQLSHPILRSKIHFNLTTSKFSFITYPKPFTNIKSISLPTTTSILGRQREKTHVVAPFHVIVEHEMSLDAWANTNYKTNPSRDLFFATVYELPAGEWMLVLRLHVVACDRTAGVALLRELLVVFRGGEVEEECGNKGEVSRGMEELVPAGKGRKALLARGLHVLGYSLGSLALTNLNFKDSRSPRRSEMLRFRLRSDETKKLLTGCETSGIKLCGVLVAAGLIAAHNNSTKSKKYGVVTMVDCRSLLDPPLSPHHFGFYHSAILNSHTVRGGERLWDLAEKCYNAFSSDKKNNKHFSDMADLNFLMGKVVDNPSLTPSGSLRTSLLCVFEDTIIDNSEEDRCVELGLEDYVGCASIHGVGPSVSMFHVVEDGRLDVVFVYPAPLHSRDQIEGLVGKIRTVLVDGGE